MSFRPDDEGDDNKSPDAASATAASSESLGYVEPDYDISDVRKALKQLWREMQTQQQQQQPELDAEAADAALRAAYVSILATLSKVASNLLRVPPTPAHLQLNLRAPAVLRFASHAGSRDFLRFLGFEERLSEAGHSMVVSAPRLEQELRRRIERALAILAKVKEEHAPQPTPGEATMEDTPGGSTAAASAAAAASTSPSVDSMSDASAPAIASSSVFLANEDSIGSSALNDLEESGDQESREAMKADLAPTYNIAEVRQALSALYEEVDAGMPWNASAAAPASAASASSAAASSANHPSPFDSRMHQLSVRESYCTILDTLAKITANLLKTPLNPQHTRINLANAAVQRFAKFAAAREYLKFLGFRPAAAVAAAGEGEATILSPQVSASNSTSPQPASADLWVISESVLAADSVKINRALSIVTKQRAEAHPTGPEQEQRTLGPVDRALRVFDLNVIAAEPARTHNANLGARDEEVGETKADLALLMAASAVERKRVHELSRTDVIVTKAKQAEIKEASKRKYLATLIKITFSDKITVQAAQGSGRYGDGSSSATSRGMSGGYRLGLKANFGVQTTAAAAAAPTSEGVQAMDLDEEKTGSATVAPPSGGAQLPVAQPVHAAASVSASSVSPVSPASSTSSSSAAAAAVVPPRELMLCAYFRPWETLADLFHFIRTTLLDPARAHEPFYLQLPPNIKFHSPGTPTTAAAGHAAGAAASKAAEADKNLSKSLQHLGLVPAAAMMFHFGSGVGIGAGSGGGVAALRADVQSTSVPFDHALLAGLIPTAENKAALEEQRLRLIAEAKAAASPSASAKNASSSSSGLGLDADGDEDMDMEAFMRAKKKKAAAAAAGHSSGGGAGAGAAASGLGGRAGGRASGSAAGSSSSSAGGSAGSAAANRVIPGLFKPKK